MSQIRGQLITPGSSHRWHPIAVDEVSPGVFALKTSIVAGGAGGTTLGTAKHYNGTGEIISSSVPFAATTKSILITNTHASQILQVSLDGGSNYYDIASGESLSLLAAHSSVDIKASAAGTTYQILTTE